VTPLLSRFAAVRQLIFFIQHTVAPRYVPSIFTTFDMAEIAGAIIGGMGICNQLFQLGREIQKAVKTIKNSRRDIGELAKETIIFADLYQRFSGVCEESDDNANGSIAVVELDAWAQTCIDGLKEMLRKVEVLLSRDRSSRSIEEKLIAYLQWLFSKSTVKALRASLSVARESINGFSTLMHLNKLDTLIKRLREAFRDQELRRDLERKFHVPLEEAVRKLEQSRLVSRSKGTFFSKTEQEMLEDGLQGEQQNTSSSYSEGSRISR
jgi:hypothetical protein